MKILILLIMGLINLEAYEKDNNKIMEKNLTDSKIKTLDVNIINEYCGELSLRKRIIMDLAVVENYNILLSSNLKEDVVKDVNEEFYIDYSETSNPRLMWKRNGSKKAEILGDNAEKVTQDGGYIYEFNASQTMLPVSLGLDASCKHVLKSSEIYIISTKEIDYNKLTVSTISDINGLSEDSKDLVLAIKQKAGEIIELETKFSEEGLAAEIDELLSEMATLNSTIEGYKENISSLKDKIRNLTSSKEDVEKLLTMIAEFEQKIEDLYEAFDIAKEKFAKLVTIYLQIEDEITKQSNKLSGLLASVGSICDLRLVVDRDILPDIENMKEYDVRYLKGEVRLDKLIYIDY